MGAKIGSERLGDLWNGKKVWKRREWRGVEDTLYDYSRWLVTMYTLGKFVAKPRNIKGFFRYRWMTNFLAAPMMIDRFTLGLRGTQLRIAHAEYDLVFDDIAKLLDNLFKGDRHVGNDEEFSKKVVLLDENEMSSLLCGFPNLKGLGREIPPVYVSVLLNQFGVTHYIDVAQEWGLPGDVCPMPEAEAGVSIEDDFPVLGACAVQCNTTCDGSLLSNGVISRRLEANGIPCFQLATPLRHTEEGVQDYAAQEIRNAIKFIEDNTGEKWDWDAYFTCAKRYNSELRDKLEWMEMSRTDYPQVIGGNLALYAETAYMAIGGKIQAFTDTNKKITRLARKGYKNKEMIVPEYRHRAVVWGVQSHYYFDFLPWLQNCWGILPLVDMLSLVSTRELSEDDPEQAIYDLAHLYENMIMRNRTHGGYEVLLDDLWKFCEYYRADMVILWEHMSCKALTGMHGMFEQQAREHGIKLIWVSHDLFDPRVVTKQGVRDCVNRYMRSVLREEPLDPSLEEIDDGNSW